jgi:nucleoside-diphosphate-sugar epimerase/1-acyl-sn-glycerol-3-phosphate acyltransferase
MNILLTGSTGFLGTGLLHYFKHKSYEGSIYLLIRDKKGSTALSRFNKLKQIFETLNLHLVTTSLNDIGELTLNVNCVINCAASIEFTLPLEEALRQNVDGLKNLIEFSKKNNVIKFIHVSTAYVSNCCKELIKEEFVDLSILDNNIDNLYKNIKNKNITFTEIQKKIFFPNTYSFTKCLAEKFIEKEIKTNSITTFSIVRPSIITSAVKIPYNGWFQGYTARLGYSALYHSGYVNYVISNGSTILNIVPVDYVCSVIYNSLCDKSTIIKHAVNFFDSTFNLNLNAKLFKNIYDINGYCCNKKTLRTLICDIKFIIKNNFKLYLLSFLSIFFPKYSKLKTKLNSIYTISRNLNETFCHFTSNTYSFDITNSISDKNDFVKELPEYCNDYDKYELSMNNSIRRSLNIEYDLTRHSFLTIILNIWSKYTCSLNLIVLTIYSFITRFILSKIYNKITVEFKNSEIIEKCIHSHKPIVILSNHQSHMDTMILKYLFLVHPTLHIINPVSIATDNFKNIPSILLYLLNLTNIQYVSRENFDKEKFTYFLNKDFNGNMILFPEGTRTKEKKNFAIQTVVYNLLKKNMDFNVLPISITYSNVPETNSFVDSLTHDKGTVLFNLLSLISFIFKLFNPFSVSSERCHVVIDKMIFPPDKIKDVEKLITHNHHSSLNKYYKDFNINNESDDYVSYYFNNIQYAKLDTHKNFEELTSFQKYIIDKQDTSIVENNVPIINNVMLNYKKLFYPIYNDLLHLHFKTNGSLFFGEYSKKIYYKMIHDNKLNDFTQDIEGFIKDTVNNERNDKSKYILVTGATGLIGSNYLEYISSLNTLTTKYIILSRNVKQNETIKIGKNEFHMLKGDITNLNIVEDIDFKLWNLKEVYHFAGFVTHYKNTKLIDEMNEINIQGTKYIGSLVSLNKNLHGKCKLTYLSTSGVLGGHSLTTRDEIKMLHESAEYNETVQNFPYYKSKTDAEKIIISHAKESDYELTIFRPSIIYGNNSMEILNKLNLPSSNKQDIFTKIKNGKLFFCLDINVNSVCVKELVKTIIYANNQTFDNKINIFNFTGNNYKMIDIFKHYNMSYIYSYPFFLELLIKITERWNIIPSLFYYMRMAKFEWELNSEKAKRELKFNPERLF